MLRQRACSPAWSPTPITTTSMSAFPPVPHGVTRHRMSGGQRSLQCARRITAGDRSGRRAGGTCARSMTRAGLVTRAGSTQRSLEGTWPPLFAVHVFAGLSMRGPPILAACYEPWASPGSGPRCRYVDWAGGTSLDSIRPWRSRRPLPYPQWPATSLDARRTAVRYETSTSPSCWSTTIVRLAPRPPVRSGRRRSARLAGASACLHQQRSGCERDERSWRLSRSCVIRQSS